MLFTVIVIIAIIAAVLLGLVVLIQNPKGGGLSGSFGGAANQIFGYKRTTDDIEKITWGLVLIVFVLCLSATAMKPADDSVNTGSNGQGLTPQTQMPANTAAPMPQQDAEQPASTDTVQ